MNENEILNSLFLAFKKQDVDTTYQILSTNDWINENTFFSKYNEDFELLGVAPFPLLNVAACFDFYEGCEILLENYGNTDLSDKNQNSPLHCAASCGNIDIMKLLLFEYNCNPTPLNYIGDLPIHIAANYNQNDAVSFLIENNINQADAKNKLGKTILSIAVEKKNLDLVEFLVNDCNCDVRTIDNHKNTLLHIASENESIEVLQFLLSLQVINIDNTNLDGQTPLHIAAAKGNFEIFCELLSQNACPLILDRKGRSIIHFSIKSSSFEIFDYIIQNELTFPFQIDTSGANPFHYAAASHDVRFLTALASLDASLINDTQCGFAPLHIACKHQLFENVVFILSNEMSDPMVENCYNQNVIHIAARSSNFNLFSFILEGGTFDVSIPDRNGVLLLSFFKLTILVDSTSLCYEKRI